MFNKTIRPRRLRTSDTLRRMVRETRISADSLIWPIFIKEGTGICDEIESLPVRPPTVPEGTSRLRISLTAAVTEEEVDSLCREL